QYASWIPDQVRDDNLKIQLRHSLEKGGRVHKIRFCAYVRQAPMGNYKLLFFFLLCRLLGVK
ncbi:hypothetical protein KAR10_09225, partial [bacterium]|nr:hypothetical protein [bacterium]